MTGLTSSYDNNNIFAKVIRKEINVPFVFSDENIIVIKDKYPIDTTHLLIIPKFEIVDMNGLIMEEEKYLSVFKSISMFIRQINIKQYKFYTNCGKSAGQEIFHLHFHFVSSEKRLND